MSKSNVPFSNSSNRNHNIPLRPGADLSGLFLSGQVIDRTRRTIQTRMIRLRKSLHIRSWILPAAVITSMNMPRMSITRSVTILLFRFMSKLSRKITAKSVIPLLFSNSSVPQEENISDF